MEQRDVEKIAAWLAAKGLEGETEVALLHGFCERCQAAGMAIGRAIVIIDTLHPVYEGRGFRWREDEVDENPLLEFKRETDGATSEGWINSPFHHLLQKGGGELRCRLHEGETAGFSAIEDVRAEGQTDYFATVHMFAPDAVLGEMDNIGSRWTTAKPDGFSDSEIAALRFLTPLLGLAIKSASLVRVSQALVEAYLGRDPGQRVLKGKIGRGQVDKINAVLWFSDLKSFTTHSETMESGQIIPFLNDHADVVISAIQAAGGDVLKLIGDGILAIFGGVKPTDAAMAALRAEADMRVRLAELHQRRMAEGVPVADVYLGLHIGDVFYGNIGSAERLDFTVVGRAVNEVSRIASMCGSVDQPVLFSTAFHETLPMEERAKLVSVGRYALRGVGRAQELFTLDPELVAGRWAGG
ncbi:adenylate/guanylate cyclase domain-containing protein [Mesorhizobium sp. LHD-90]|uniref:adenylate/guanylate cyclase domain-containing protein n=1 Tax=Mesorhizobium sp. LHD-90 TaxID=3071414 RepID=UPI0027DFD63D|nr:adenylate/guanylate cyclase domain-containing protein [Mesorhizobium sp. LHD-90]MDQ6432440.1 adenylate/guanylate cyclase domain-containing protein [Mesorhizobium sp. LHD-90]